MAPTTIPIAASTHEAVIRIAYPFLCFLREWAQPAVRSRPLSPFTENLSTGFHRNLVTTWESSGAVHFALDEGVVEAATQEWVGRAPAL